MELGDTKDLILIVVGALTIINIMWNWVIKPVKFTKNIEAQINTLNIQFNRHLYEHHGINQTEWWNVPSE